MNKLADGPEVVERDYRAMRPWLPVAASTILDIGCGNAAIDVWLALHYGGAIDVHLMDGDADVPPIGKEQVNFHAETSPWKDRRIGIAALRAAVPGCRVHGHEPDPAATIPCDLIVSRRSWGLHYPVGVYLSLAQRSLRRGGRIIIDIRAGTKGVKEMAAGGFKAISGDLDGSTFKCARLAFERMNK